MPNMLPPWLMMGQEASAAPAQQPFPGRAAPRPPPQPQAFQEQDWQPALGNFNVGAMPGGDQMGPPDALAPGPQEVLAQQNAAANAQASMPQTPPRAPVSRSSSSSSSTSTSKTFPTGTAADAIKSLNDKELDSLKQQGISIGDLKTKLKALEGKEVPRDLSMWTSLIDSWTGSKFTESYKPETRKERQASIERLQNAIASGQQGLSENEIAMLKGQLDNQFKLTNLDVTKDQNSEHNKQEWAKIGIERDKAGKEKSAHILPGSAIATYTDSQGAVGMASDLTNVIDQNSKYMGPVEGGIFSKNPYEAERRNLVAKFDLVRQKIGKMVEGGVLRKEDEEKYTKILPSISDLPEVAKTKAKTMEAMLKDDLGRYMENYGRAGYDVSGFAGQTDSYKKDAATLHGQQAQYDEDKQYTDWARTTLADKKASPQDRAHAQDILKLNGVK